MNLVDISLVRFVILKRLISFKSDCLTGSFRWNSETYSGLDNYSFPRGQVSQVASSNRDIRTSQIWTEYESRAGYRLTLFPEISVAGVDAVTNGQRSKLILHRTYFYDPLLFPSSFRSPFRYSFSVIPCNYFSWKSRDPGVYQLSCYQVLFACIFPREEIFETLIEIFWQYRNYL